MGMTQAEFDQLCRRAGAPTDKYRVREKLSKLKNVRKVVGAISFQSSLEARAYQILKLWHDAGAISDLRMQPSFTLQEFFKDAEGRSVKAIKYSADFRFFDNEARRVRYVDAKGMVTKMFLRTMKQMKDKYPDIEIEVWDKTKIKELSRC